MRCEIICFPLVLTSEWLMLMRISKFLSALFTILIHFLKVFLCSLATLFEFQCANSQFSGVLKIMECMIIYFRYSGNVRHIKIEKNSEGMYFMSDTRFFHSLPVSNFLLLNMSHVMRNPTFCICENKDADQLRGNREADQRLCFRFKDSTIPLLSKSEISSL